MPRLPLGDLETALRDPISYRNKINAARDSGFGKSYFGFLRFAIFKYHTANDFVGSRRYLEENLDSFKSTTRRIETLEQFEWYVEEYIGRGWLTFRTRLRIQVRLPNWVPVDLRCSGEIPRVDVIPQGGYAAWLMKSREPEGWEQQLRMPLIQDTVALLLNVPIEEVQVGIYSFVEKFVASRVYTGREIQGSYSTLANLLKEMEY